MAKALDDSRIRFFIGDVRDRSRLELAMRNVETVVHAAALKIVPTAEYNPTECIATNIKGAENVALAAINCGVKKVIALSTDKAVNPINLYGATKLCAEKIFIAANSLSVGKPFFSVVRYGNVAGSQGSVLPLFLKISKGGGSLPVTDTRMTRFWIPMDHAINMVMIAYEAMKGREVFIPKIPSINILNLAESISSNWHISGIRPGEKLHEVLIGEDELPYTVEFTDHYRILTTRQKHQPSSLISSYSSDDNPEFLTTSQLKEMIHGQEEGTQNPIREDQANSESACKE